jgi:hypothetical protein
MMAGKYGKAYGQLNVINFMEMFDTYLNERYAALINIREEEHAQFKTLGDDGTRESDNAGPEFKELQRIAVYKHFAADPAAGKK